MIDFLDYEIRATDVTINEANGSFEMVKSLMEKDEILSYGKKKHNWVLRSNIAVINVFGYNEMICQFHNDGSVDILEYQPTVRDVFYNQDIRCLSHWCSINGWKKPQPAPRIINDKLDFWKHQWNTHVIDSSYLDNKFGKRNDEDPSADVIEDE